MFFRTRNVPEGREADNTKRKSSPWKSPSRHTDDAQLLGYEQQNANLHSSVSSLRAVFLSNAYARSMTSRSTAELRLESLECESSTECPPSVALKCQTNKLLSPPPESPLSVGQRFPLRELLSNTSLGSPTNTLGKGYSGKAVMSRLLVYGFCSPFLLLERF